MASLIWVSMNANTLACWCWTNLANRASKSFRLIFAAPKSFYMFCHRVGAGCLGKIIFVQLESGDCSDFSFCADYCCLADCLEKIFLGRENHFLVELDKWRLLDLSFFVSTAAWQAAGHSPISQKRFSLPKNHFFPGSLPLSQSAPMMFAHVWSVCCFGLSPNWLLEWKTRWIQRGEWRKHRTNCQRDWLY